MEENMKRPIERFRMPDLHMHSTFSDGSDTPEELIGKVKQAGVDLFSLTDHDSISGCEIVAENLSQGDPKFIRGVEFSCNDGNGKCHVLGYGYDPGKPSIRNAVNFTHDNRIEKAVNSFRYLKDLGYGFSEQDVSKVLEMKNPGKPHFVALLMEYGYITDKKRGYDILYGYHGQEKELTPDQAIEAILQADGIPVLAHGILADGREILSEERIRERVRKLKEAGIMGLECYYSSFTDEQRDIMLRLAKEFDLMITAGSDYHGQAKSVRIGQTGCRQYECIQQFCDLVTKI